MNNPSVTVIVLNWNGRELVLRCLRSLQGLTYPNYDVLVVDNGSEDGSVDAISLDFPEVQVIRLPENYGFARGNNEGLKEAWEKEPDWILFLNNDTEVDPDLLNALIAGTEQYPKSGLFGPKIYYGDKNLIWYAGGEISFFLGRTRHRGIRQQDREDFDQPGPTDFVSGCCLLIRSDLVQRLEGFNTRYPMYMEDVDLCYRASQIGIPSYYLPSGKVWHHVSSSLGGELSLRKVWLKWCSSMRFFWAYAKPWRWITILIYQILFYTMIGPIRYTKQKWFRVA
ncbi:glycosyltransferase family 2 protein [Candidatus Neomarinimicrobiota bacterium]